MLKKHFAKKSVRLAIPLILLATLTPTAFALELRAKIDPLAQPLIDNKIAVGFVVGIVHGDESQILTYGETKKGSGVKPNGDTLYEIGSISKVFTSVLLADASLAGTASNDTAEKKLVKLDDPIQKYLPADVRMPMFDGKAITLEHLSTHRSGLPRMPSNFQPADFTDPFADYSDERLFNFIRGHKPRRAPGKFEYSNLGAGLLGQLVATHHKKSYEQCLIDRICKPLGMKDTRLTLSESQLARFASPYNANLQPSYAWSFDSLAGAGGIRSTASDMIRFIQANLADDNRPITQALQLARKPRHKLKGNPRMGLGWLIGQDKATRLHDGMTGGYHSFVAVIPNQKIGVVVLYNTSTIDASEFSAQVVQVAQGKKVEPPTQHKEVAIKESLLNKYVGVYELMPKISLTVTIKKGKLMVQMTGQPKIQIYAESNTKFFLKVVDAQITFVANDDGSISHLVLHQNGANQKAVRKK